MDDDTGNAKNVIRKWLDSLLVRIPELVLAFIGGVGWVIFTVWLSNRGLVERFNDVDEYIKADKAHMEQLADCVKRPECEAVRAVLHAHELRVTKLEGEFTGHERLARERIERIKSVEDEVRRLAAIIAARPEHFHDRARGTEQ